MNSINSKNPINPINSTNPKNSIPVVILCGGMGTRLSEYTEVRSKPLVGIGGRPILWHIMKHYSHYGFNEFYLASRYKGELIKKYFLDFYTLNQDFSVFLENGHVRTIEENGVEPWKIHLIDTGQSTLTGGRLKKLEPLIGKGTYMITYGDGVSNVNLDNLLSFHREQKAMVTLTAVRPPLVLAHSSSMVIRLGTSKRNLPSAKVGSTEVSLSLSPTRLFTSKKTLCGSTTRWAVGRRRELVCLPASRFLAMYGHSQRLKIPGNALGKWPTFLENLVKGRESHCEAKQSRYQSVKSRHGPHLCPY